MKRNSVSYPSFSDVQQYPINSKSQKVHSAYLREAPRGKFSRSNGVFMSNSLFSSFDSGSVALKQSIRSFSHVGASSARIGNALGTGALSPFAPGSMPSGRRSKASTKHQKHSKKGNGLKQSKSSCDIMGLELRYALETGAVEISTPQPSELSARLVDDSLVLTDNTHSLSSSTRDALQSNNVFSGIQSHPVALTRRRQHRVVAEDTTEEMPRPMVLKRVHSRTRMQYPAVSRSTSSTPAPTSSTTIMSTNGTIFPSATIYSSASQPPREPKVYTSSDPVTPKLLASIRLPPEALQNIRSAHLKKMSSAAVSSKYYFEHKYAALLNKKNGFHEKRGKRRKKKHSNNGSLAKLHPINAQEEKEKFLRCHQLGLELKNPKFKYQKKFLASLSASKKNASAVWQNNTFENTDVEGTHPYNFVCTKYLGVAMRIMQKMKRQYGSLHGWYLSMGDRVSSEDSLNYFAFYLRDQGLARLGITIEVCEDAASPTFCVGKTLLIRAPMKNYRLGRIQGVAHHEISTHLIRYINDTKQVWHKKKNVYGLRSHIVIEEGLATVNSCVHSSHKLLAHAAIHYYAVVQASRMNFVQLFDCLLPWIGDAERTWTECLRVKRGISAKRKCGAFTKDQIYLIGSLRILKLRRKLDFRLMYAGKLALEDLERVQQSDIGVNLDDLIMPKFISEDFDHYMNALDEIAAVNGVK